MPDMTFFITSAGSGKGADFGGLAGADKHCQNLAAAAGAGKHTWRAYLSTTGSGGGQRARPHRQGPVVQRGGQADRARRRRAARRQRHQQDDRADREEDQGQRPRRVAQPARHPHRLAPGRHGLHRERRHDLQQLDEQRQGLRARRPSRPLGSPATPIRRCRGIPRTARRAAASRRWSARAARD